MVFSFAINSITCGCHKFLLHAVISQFVVLSRQWASREKTDCFFGGDESSCLSLWDTKSYASTLQLCCLFSTWVMENRFYELVVLVWSHMDYKFPLAVFYGSIDLNFVCIASPVSPSPSPTAPSHFMATLLPEYVHLPVWIWLMAFMFFFGSFALLFLWEKILYWSDNGEKNSHHCWWCWHTFKQQAEHICLKCAISALRAEK